MAKRVFGVMLVALLILFTASADAANRGLHPRSDDRDYVWVSTIQDYTRNAASVYLNKKSVGVQVYNPPTYQIEGVFSCDAGYFGDENDEYRNYLNEVGGRVYREGGYERFFHLVVRYNFNTRESFHRSNGSWVKNTSPRSKMAANALFQVAYNMKFHDDVD